MTSKQTRRTSSFADMDSPIEPPVVKEAAATGSNEGQPATQGSATAKQASADVKVAKSAPGAPAAKVKKEKVSFYLLPSEEARARAAWMHTMGHTQHRFITSFFEAAIASYTRELEKQYNDSKPFN